MKKVFLLAILGVTAIGPVLSYASTPRDASTITAEIQSRYTANPDTQSLDKIMDTVDRFDSHMTPEQSAQEQVFVGKAEKAQYAFLRSHSVTVPSDATLAKVQADARLTPAEEAELATMYSGIESLSESDFAGYQAIMDQAYAEWNAYLTSIGRPSIPTDLTDRVNEWYDTEIAPLAEEFWAIDTPDTDADLSGATAD